MQVQLAYGRGGLDIEIPDSADVIRPRFVPGLVDEATGIREALRNPTGSIPLVDKIHPGDQIVIVHTDITRATPNDRIMPVLIHEIKSAGIPDGDITLLNGLGTHRPQTQGELRAMLGDEIVDRYRCIQHNCHDDDQLVPLGKTSLGHPVRINRTYMEADVRILTGFIEPHFFAGFSGGPKAILPSLSGVESVFTNHKLDMIAHPNSTWGVTEGNLIWEEMKEVAMRTNPTFLLNVALNADREISGVFAGDLLKAHAEGCEFVKSNAMVGVDEPYDVVVTTNSGHPLDQNLYQSVKGVSAASQIVRDGGAIIIATACEDGLPDHGFYASLLAEGGSPKGVLDVISQPGFSTQDQWQVQIQAQIQMRTDVFVYSDGLSENQIRRALFIPCSDIPREIIDLRSKYGPSTRICVLPEGPQTIPYL